MDSHTNSGISPIHADRYIKVCPTCGQVIPNDAEAARIQAACRPVSGPRMDDEPDGDE